MVVRDWSWTEVGQSVDGAQRGVREGLEGGDKRYEVEHNRREDVR